MMGISMNVWKLTGWGKMSTISRLTLESIGLSILICGAYTGVVVLIWRGI